MRVLQPIERVSRRRFMSYGAASLAAAPALAQTVPPTADPETAKIAAATDAFKHLTIDVMVTGKGPFRFVVDTGADRSVIADDAARALGLIRGDTVTVQGVVRSVKTQTVAISDISFGSIRRQNLVMPVLPRALLDADGYLGLDAIDGCRVTLSFKDHTLVIGQPRHTYLWQPSSHNTALIPVRGSMGHLRSINCRVDGVSTTAFIDTGAEVSVGNSHLLNSLLDDDPNYRILGQIPLTGVTGGEIEGTLTMVHRIRLNSVDFTECPLVIADMQIFNLWGLGDQPALLVGMNFLRQFAQVSVDYGRKEIMFDLASMVLAQRG